MTGIPGRRESALPRRREGGSDGLAPQGQRRLGVFIDDQATDDQADKLTAVFRGQLGRPMEALAPLVGEMLGVERAPIEIVDEGVRHSVRVGDAIDVEIEDIVPLGVDTGEPAPMTDIFHPVASTLTAAKAKRSRIDAFGMSRRGSRDSRGSSSPGRRSLGCPPDDYSVVRETPDW